MKPEERDINKLEVWGVRQFANWLRVGLEEYFIFEGGIRGFRPLEYCIFHEHTLYGDLVEIYEAFPKKQQEKIRKAIALVISELPAEQLYAQIFHELLWFAEAIKAKEVLEVLPAIGESFRSLTENTDGLSLDHHVDRLQKSLQ